MIRILLNIYIIVLVVDAILSYIPKLRFTPVRLKVKKVADFTLNPVRKLLPNDLPVDLSPLVVIAGIKLIQVLW